MRNALLVIQVGTFVGLGVLLVRAGSWKLGVGIDPMERLKPIGDRRAPQIVIPSVHET